MWSDINSWLAQHMPLFSLSNKVFTGIYSTYYKATLMVDGLSKRFISYQHFTFLPVLLVARFGAPCRFSRALSRVLHNESERACKPGLAHCCCVHQEVCCLPRRAIYFISRTRRTTICPQNAKFVRQTLCASTCARRRVLHHVHHPPGVAHAAFHLQAGGSGGFPRLLCLVRAAFAIIKHQDA